MIEQASFEAAVSQTAELAALALDDRAKSLTRLSRVVTCSHGDTCGAPLEPEQAL